MATKITHLSLPDAKSSHRGSQKYQVVLKFFPSFSDNFFKHFTGWPFRLCQTSRWRQNKSCVLLNGPHTKTELLFWWQREVWDNQNSHHVIVSMVKLTMIIVLLLWSVRLRQKRANKASIYLYLRRREFGRSGGEKLFYGVAKSCRQPSQPSSFSKAN